MANGNVDYDEGGIFKYGETDFRTNDLEQLDSQLEKDTTPHLHKNKLQIKCQNKVKPHKD